MLMMSVAMVWPFGYEQIVKEVGKANRVKLDCKKFNDSVNSLSSQVVFCVRV